MENQMSPDDRPSRDSSISLEDHGGPVPRLSRSDLYTAHQPQGEAYGPARPEPFFTIPLDFPNTYTAGESSTDAEPSHPVVESSSLSALRLERYLAEEHCHERLALGMPPLGVNKATVKRYLPDIIRNIDSTSSQGRATCGTATDCDEGECRGSVAPSASTASDGSSEAINADSSNRFLADTAPLGQLLTTSSSNQHITPSLAGLSQADAAPLKSERALASSESHHMGSDTCEQDIEIERILMHHRTRGRGRHEEWRVAKQARVRKHIRQRKRWEELPRRRGDVTGASKHQSA
ncbi:hypothetical protein V8C37DRAFT_380883 [Trichoderma ceciliae]